MRVSSASSRGSDWTRRISLTPESWSPDGRHILLNCDDRVCVVNLDGELVGVSPPLKPVVRRQGVATAWSPDGSRVAVFGEFDVARHSRDQSEPIVLFTMAPDGSDVRYLLSRRKNGKLKPLGAVRVREFELFPGCGAVLDCEVLWRLWDTLAGSPTLKWWSYGHMLWEGVKLAGLRVESLALPERRLWGRIPAELRELPELRRVLLGGNLLYGSIPVELGQIAKLTHLDLNGNELTGPIPPALGQIAKLTHLDLNGNELTGPIPPALGQIANLIHLDLSGNELTGPIPTELTQLVDLKYLYLAGNELTGCIPPTLHRIPHNDLASLGLPDCESE